LASGSSGGNGLYRYGTGGVMPTSSWNDANYWVDVVFSDSIAPTLTARSPAPGATGVSTAAPIAVTYSEPVQTATIGLGLTGPGGAVAGTSSYDSATRTASFTPSAPLALSTSYTVTASGTKDLSGNTMAPATWTFATAGSCPCRLFASDSVPAVASANDPGPVNLGMRFVPQVNGTVTAIRFYKGPANTGTHVGTLWSPTGNVLATVTFANESASGWQTATLSSPISVTAGSQYVVSYLAPNGGYAANSNFFAQPYSNGPLQGLMGLYAYGATTSLPASSFMASNYWVDVEFSPT
jgi:Domain of unknown function (DUF4082)/Bacterial Ig-like domain